MKRRRPSSQAHVARRLLGCGLLLCLVGGGCTAIDFTEPSGGGAGSPSGGASGSGGSLPIGGAAPNVEMCGNGVDDDGDQLVDCDDPECTLGCEVPSGWAGFASLRADGCNAGEVLLQRAYMSATGDSACTCVCSGAPTCVFVVAVAYAGLQCGGNSSSAFLAMGCTTLGAPGSDSIKISSSGTCPGTPTAALTQPTPTTVAADLCETPKGACVYAPGMLACPSGFPVAQVYQSTLVDSRSCEPTSCGCAPNCGNVTLHQDAACADAGTALVPDACFTQVGPYNVSFDESTQACVPSGAATGSGDVSLADPITVCCR